MKRDSNGYCHTPALTVEGPDETFTIRSTRVLKLKQRREQLAEIKQGQAAAAVQAAQSEVAALGERLRQACLRLQEKVGKPQETTIWMAIYVQSAQLQQALQNAGER